MRGQPGPWNARSAASAGPAPRELGATQEGHRGPARRAPRRPRRGRHRDRDRARPGERQRRQQRGSGRRLVQHHEQPAGRAVGGEHARDGAHGGGRRGDEQRLERLDRGQVGARGPHRAADADRAQPALDLGAGRGGEQYGGSGERDQRERHEQVDHDPRRLVEHHADARAGDEPHAVQAVAGGPGLDQDLVEVARVAQPDVRQVDAERPEPARRHIHPRRRQRIAHVVGALREADDPLLAKPVDVERVADVQAPGGGQPAFDDDLAGPRHVTTPDDCVAASARPDDLDRTVVRELIGGFQADADDLPAQGEPRHVGEVGDPLCDPVGGLDVEADDHVGEAGGARRPVEAEPEPIRDDQRRHQHRRGQRDAEPGQQRAPAPGPHSIARLCEGRPQADSLSRTSSGASLPPARCSTRSAIAAASGSWVTITTARR
jgi:hypothetical protein